MWVTNLGTLPDSAVSIQTMYHRKDLQAIGSELIQTRTRHSPGEMTEGRKPRTNSGCPAFFCCITATAARSVTTRVARFTLSRAPPSGLPLFAPWHIHNSFVFVAFRVRLSGCYPHWGFRGIVHQLPRDNCWNLMPYWVAVHYPPLVLILSQINPVRFTTSYLSNIRFILSYG
jgi:hypothetical protein